MDKLVIFKAETDWSLGSIYERFLHPVRGVGIGLVGKGDLFLDRIGSSNSVLEVNQTLRRFPICPGQQWGRPESGQMQGDLENGTDLKITSETGLELKIQAQWVTQSWRWGGKEKSRMTEGLALDGWTSMRLWEVGNIREWIIPSDMDWP